MRVLIADDHTLLRDTMKGYLESSDLNLEVMAAASLTEAVAIARQAPKPFDLVLLDLDMPGMNGMAGIGEMRKAHPGPPIGIVSALATSENVMAAIDAGAAAFIPKTMGAKAMLVALRLVLAGERYVPAGFLKTAHEAGARSTERQFQPMLSAPEAGVLKLLKEGKSNKEIGRTLGLEEYTVKYHVRGIFKKLGARNRSQAVKIAMERDLPGAEGNR